MEENFDLLAQSRANYYTKGSPVQFVRVELLKGDTSGDIAVCLSFKNITSRPLIGLNIQFKCKDRTGNIVCVDRYDYTDLNTANGQVFGADDAVYISADPIGSVEVDLMQATFADGSSVDLTTFGRVRLPQPKKLPGEIAQKLSERTRKEGLIYAPQVLDDGWYCACGAFHPRAEEGVWCSECGADRILLQNTLSNLLQANAPQAPATDSEPTRMAPPIRPEEPTRMAPPIRGDQDYAQQSQPTAGYVDDYDDSDMQIAQPRRTEAPMQNDRSRQQLDYNQLGYGNEQEAEREPDEETLRKDEIAEQIIRWAPPITAVLCAIIAVIGFFLL